MHIHEQQLNILRKYGVTISEDARETLLALDTKMLEIGFDEDDSLNKTGVILQSLYDELYHQNNGSNP